MRNNYSLLFRRVVAASTTLCFLSGCVSTTLIRTEPSEAALYVDGSKVGKTPYTYEDTKPTGSITYLRFVKEGYEERQATLVRNEAVDVGAIVGGLLVWVPFLWVMGYKPEHTYELAPLKKEPTRRGSVDRKRTPDAI
jgi:hypothetical protein